MSSGMKDIIPDLECPVCYEYMVPPITLCENGHNICKSCKPRLSFCPNCRGKLLAVRPIVLEKVIQRLHYPCKYHGCSQTFLLEDMPEHIDICLFKPHMCPFGATESNCSWEGLVFDIRYHITRKHMCEVLLHSPDGKFTCVLSRMKENKKWQRIIFTLGEIFFFRIFTTDKELFACIFHVGYKVTAGNYKYKLTFNTKDGTENITSFNVTRNYLENIKYVVEAEKCSVMRYKFIKKCVGASCGLVVGGEIMSRDS